MMGDYKIPSLTTDIFIFDENTDFILIKRKNDPFKSLGSSRRLCRIW